MSTDVLRDVISIQGYLIRVTVQQWAHVTEAHDYMAGNLDLVVETIAEPSRIIRRSTGQYLALRDYPRTNITRKTAVVVYRDEPDGFVITAYLTTRPDKTERSGEKYGRYDTAAQFSSLFAGLARQTGLG